MKDNTGKIVLITGATSGIGKETAIQLAKRGFEVIIHGRNEKKAEETAREIYDTVGKKVSVMLADFSSLESVNALADQFLEKYGRLDVLISNAGGVFMEEAVSGDGFEITFAVNYLSHYLLTLRLLPVLEKAAPSRIITLSSEAHRFIGKIDVENVAKPGFYKGFTAYSAAKVCETLFTYKTAELLKDQNITSNCVHPGFVATGFGLNSSNPIIRAVMKFSANLARTPEKGAETSVFLASSDAAAGITGNYFADSKPGKSSRITHDKELQKQLYEVSEALVKKYL